MFAIPSATWSGLLAEVSTARRAIVIGEDLGVVPAGFREVMRQTEIQGYRVFFFEKDGDRFLAAEGLPARGARLRHDPRHAHPRRMVDGP